MESNNFNFDATLGGSERLPHSANSLRFATSRSIEIAAMTENILRPSKTKLIFQTLPVHMRRRVMSHNCKRLPRRLREGHFEQLKKSGLPPKQKRPSRKYRRRPANLLLEYQRRQRSHRWLESHIWHAKRFHMVQRWGYRLALAPCDKAFRACYRASSAHCLLQDVSYMECLEITGMMSVIDSTFRRITRSGEGLAVCARAYCTGNREGSAHIYRPDVKECDYVGKVDFMWKPIDASEAERTLWLFIHPSFYQDIIDLIVEVIADLSDKEEKVPLKRKKPNPEVLLDEKIKITHLKHRLNRFRLTGPKSQAVLARALKLIDNDETISNNGWVKCLKNIKELRLKEKSEYWESLKELSSPGELPARVVLGIVVRDPRLTRPPKRIKAQLDTYNPTSAHILCSIPPYAAASPLWHHHIHDEILTKKWSDGQLIEYATKHQLVPGEPHEDNPAVQSVPVMLVQRPGSQNPHIKKLGYGSGWDIIMPAGYSLAFWRSFIMLGARAGGLRETESIAHERGRCLISPDSTAGQNEEIRIYKEMNDKYFCLPPNKRVNYTKLGINSPFRCQWKVLIKEWSETQEAPRVLRNRQLLLTLQDCIQKKTEFKGPLPPCLIPVVLKSIGKGKLESHALICLPQKDDIKNIDNLFESAHQDPREKERKSLRKDNRTMLKRLRRQRVKLKKKNKSKVRTTKAKSNNELSEYTKKMRELWLPSLIECVRTSCDRPVMGYCSRAGFSFTEARGGGAGYVASDSLLQLLFSGLSAVLVRNCTSRKYRLADINIIVDP